VAKSHLPVIDFWVWGAASAAQIGEKTGFYDCLKKTRVFFKQFSPAGKPSIDIHAHHVSSPPLAMHRHAAHIFRAREFAPSALFCVDAWNGCAACGRPPPGFGLGRRSPRRPLSRGSGASKQARRRPAPPTPSFPPPWPAFRSFLCGGRCFRGRFRPVSSRPWRRPFPCRRRCRQARRPFAQAAFLKCS